MGRGSFWAFATVALTLVFQRIAIATSLVAASLFMLGGVLGTLHHMYFSGTSTPVMGIGATFSALEVVLFILLGYEAWDNWRHKARVHWMNAIKWPLVCFVAVAF